MKKLLNKIKWKILKGLDWLNGFSFRFFFVILAVIILSFAFVVLAVLLFCLAVYSIFWIVFGKERSLEEYKEKIPDRA